MISELTYKMVAYLEIQPLDANDCIDWAIEMMELGYESPSLFMLASFSKPVSYFDVTGYVKDTVEELGFHMKRGTPAILSYASFYVHKIAKRDQIQKNLASLYELYVSSNFNDLLYDYYLLYWAWDDVDYYEQHIGFNPYWEGANRANIQDIVVDVANKWIEKNRKIYELKSPKQP